MTIATKNFELSHENVRVHANVTVNGSASPGLAIEPLAAFLSKGEHTGTDMKNESKTRANVSVGPCDCKRMR